MLMQTSNPSYEQSSFEGERGFTLVELMVVVAIIALIATIIIPNFVHARQEAQVSTSEANLKQIATALELYYNDTDEYPANAGNVTPALFAISGVTDGTKYLPTAPTDPVTGGAYTYQVDLAPGNPTYGVQAPGVYDVSALTKVAACPQGLSNTNGVAGSQLVYSPSVGICKV